MLKLKDVFLDYIDKLRKSKIIIVEGKKDIIALKEFNIHNVIDLKKPLFKLAEEISSKYSEVVILTDLDKEGKTLYSKIRKNLIRNGIKIDDSFRNFLYKKTKLRQIEGLAKYFRKINKDL